MKFLISNYINHWNTEALYFNAGLNLIDGVESIIMDNQRSVYDNFDSVHPNVFITHLSQISKDTVSYLKHNNIQLIINVNGIPKDAIDNASTVLSSEKLSPIFFGEEDIKIDGSKYFRVLSAADTFLSYGNKEYSIQKLIFVNNPDDILDMDGTYHYATINQEIANQVDLFLPISSLNSLFGNYDEIIFKGGSYIGTQLIFNAIYSGTKVFFETKDSNDLEKIDSIFKGQKLLSSVKNKHTGLHRLKSFLSQLSHLELANGLESIINKS
jgi:hypothetical protein